MYSSLRNRITGLAGDVAAPEQLKTCTPVGTPTARHCASPMKPVRNRSSTVSCGCAYTVAAYRWWRPISRKNWRWRSQRNGCAVV